ncbi:MULTISPECIES: hypothetical protein [Desulfococcus]|uniref:Uncharacterized protein n=1 Tax=Desulfococcus multivorans DSM 2059 TaxID=1121405 RepID=S7V2U9_DESML|nr:hypothetical protein [Desulfococcus multivorans]AOY56943.1 uncharacterized protein Dmul_01670 [Desulfococcus multivorans]AQU99469.1 hypothetical protein B2D07_00855 [Desulfococcus multivorans]EPR40799.1 hypothetical protein dsmv_2302 [Desulfococcus multivorans DSM 2059]SKA20929.1 hypothetical protein SAMN02745446_03262 [Desulfococcus multivorans DSM 2059]
MSISTEAPQGTKQGKPKNKTADAGTGGRPAKLSLTALGMVFGGIDTSPIYAFGRAFTVNTVLP